MDACAELASATDNQAWYAGVWLVCPQRLGPRGNQTSRNGGRVRASTVCIHTAYPSTLGSHSAISGNIATSTSALPITTTNSIAQPTVCSRRILATSAVTIRLMATGGVNWQ